MDHLEPTLEIRFGRTALLHGDGDHTCFACGRESAQWADETSLVPVGYSFAKIICQCGAEGCRPFLVALCESCFNAKKTASVAIAKRLDPDIDVSKGGTHVLIASDGGETVH